jgi:ribosomal protein L37AE/L43A
MKIESITTYSQEYILCPHCGEKSGQRICHLYDQTPRRFGPWACENCDKYFSGTVNAPSDVTLVKEDKPPKKRLLTLLKFPGKDGDVFFIQNHFDYGHSDPYDELQSHNQYFFEEHSCPTNWLRNTAVVVQNGDHDPHGFLEYVRTVRVEKDFDEDDYELVEKTFPEVKHVEAV